MKEKKREVFAGIDVGGTSIKAGLFDSKYNLLSRFSLPVCKDDSPADCFIALADWLKAPEVTNQYNVLSAGMGLPGLFDQDSGALKMAPNLPKWVGFGIRGFFEKETGIDIVIDNDANMAALGEYEVGSGSDFASMVMLTLGTGVGGAIIVDGKMLELNGFSSELGHMIIDIDGVLCNCGHRGCLETLTAKNGLLRLFNKTLDTNGVEKSNYKNLDQLTPLHLSKLAEEGDQFAMETFRQSGKAVGIGISNILNIIRLDGIVIGGGISNAWDGFFQSIQETVAKLTFDFNPETTKIRKASLGSDAGIIGSAVAVRKMNSEK
jgi:glucokinase